MLGRTSQFLPPHSSVGGHLDCGHTLAVVSITAMTRGEELCLLGGERGCRGIWEASVLSPIVVAIIHGSFPHTVPTLAISGLFDQVSFPGI